MATVTLTPGLTYTPPKCDLCEAKTNPHPAQLSVSRNGTADTTPYVLCPRCDTALAKLAAILGPAPSTFQVVTDPTGGLVQARMDFDSDPPATTEEPPATDDSAHCSRCGIALHTDAERERTTCDDCDGRGPDDGPDDDRDGGDGGPGDGGDDTIDEPAWMRTPALPDSRAGATDLLALPPPQPAREPVAIRRRRGRGPDAE